MICVADNDIVKKLAICNLLDEAVGALGASHAEMLVLPTARFKLGVAKNPDKARARLGNETFDRLSSFLSKVGVIDTMPPPDEQKLFDDAFDIDTGEAILFLRNGPLRRMPRGDRRQKKPSCTVCSCKCRANHRAHERRRHLFRAEHDANHQTIGLRLGSDQGRSRMRLRYRAAGCIRLGFGGHGGGRQAKFRNLYGRLAEGDRKSACRGPSVAIRSAGRVSWGHGRRRRQKL